MADRSTELFTAIFAALNGDAALTALLGGAKVFNGVKDGTEPPYVDIGDDTATDYSSSLIDAQEHTITIHSWAEQPMAGVSAKGQLFQIMARIRAILHAAPPVLAAGTLVNLRQEFRETLRDPDGVSWHGVQRFRAVTNS